MALLIISLIPGMLPSLSARSSLLPQRNQVVQTWPSGSLQLLIICGGVRKAVKRTQRCCGRSGYQLYTMLPTDTSGQETGTSTNAVMNHLTPSNSGRRSG